MVLSFGDGWGESHHRKPLGGTALLAGAAFALCAVHGQAQAAAPALWLSPGGVSMHSRSGANGNNAGLILEAEWSDDWSTVAGRIRNSANLHSNFVAAKYTPWHASGGSGVLMVKAGFFAGAIDGYPINNRQPQPFGGFVTEVGTDRVRVAAMLIPPATGTSAALLITLKVRLP